MAFTFLKDYLLHRLTAKSRHGTHSPFVYKLADEVIYNKRQVEDYHIIEAQRKRLLADDALIQVTDLGAGSHLNKDRTKKVKQIAKHALKRPALAQLIYRLASFTNPGLIIELGTCLGITTSYLAKAAPQASVVTIEGCPQTAEVAKRNFTALGLQNIKLEVGNFDQILPGILDAQQKLDFVYVDGNHRKDATLNYFRWCLPKVHENTMLIFDDIYWSQGMKEAWAEIKAHPQVTVTVDLFWIGLVFFKKGQARQDFKLKV
jgi:predicted O-methyltransferase YrrM